MPLLQEKYEVIVKIETANPVRTCTYNGDTGKLYLGVPKEERGTPEIWVSMDRPLRVYLWLAFGITWGAGGLALFTGGIRSGAAHPLHPLHYLAAFGPSIAGFIMAAATGGWDGVGRLLARLAPTWRHVPWYAAVLLGFPAANVAATWLLAPDSLTRLPSWDRLICLVPLTLVLDTGPLGEEFGWRGFALPRLLRRWRPLAAALILGAIWWAWHLPTFFIQALSQNQLSIPVFLVNSIALSILMTGLHLRTRGDLFLMILIHLMANYCGTIGIPFGAEVSAEVALAVLIMATGLLRPDVQRVDEKAYTESPADEQHSHTRQADVPDSVDGSSG